MLYRTKERRDKVKAYMNWINKYKLYDLRSVFIYQDKSIYRSDLVIMVNDSATRAKLVKVADSGEIIILAKNRPQMFHYLYDHDLTINKEDWV